MKNVIPRDVAKILIVKLELGEARPAIVKRLALSSYSVELDGKTRRQVIRSIRENTEEHKKEQINPCTS